MAAGDAQSKAMQCSILFFATAAVLILLGGCSQAGFGQSANPGECRTLCAQYDAAREASVLEASQREANQRAEQIDHNAKSIARINVYFEAHPNAPRPPGCTLPMKPDNLESCEANMKAAEGGPGPPREWHRTIRDTVGCSRNGVYSDGEYVGATEGCVEIHTGQVFLLQPSVSIGEGGSDTFRGPLAEKLAAAVTGGFSSMLIPSSAFSRKILHCDARQVLLHVEVRCQD
jgi:hypothetical protein